MDVLGHGVTLDKFQFLLATQLTDDLSYFATEAAIKHLLTVLRDDHYTNYRYSNNGVCRKDTNLDEYVVLEFIV